MMWILAYLLCIVCPPLGGFLLIIMCIANLSTKSGRADYCNHTANYYRSRNAYFKKTYGV